MAKQLQLRGGTTAEHSTFTGANKEVTVDTDKNTLIVHDGITVGGTPLATEAALNTVADAINGGQFLGTGLIKGVQYMSQEASGDIVIATGLNSFAVDSIEIQDGSSITVEDGSTFKII